MALYQEEMRLIVRLQNNERSERGLIVLNEILNHSIIKTTKIYLGIRDKEIQDVYQNL
jgi:hypothetical protein